MPSSKSLKSDYKLPTNAPKRSIKKKKINKRSRKINGAQIASSRARLGSRSVNLSVFGKDFN